MKNFRMILPCDRVRGFGKWRKLESTILYFYKGHYLSVPKGFIFDGASRPWFIGWWMPRFSKWTNCAAACHDRLYSTKELSRRESDLVFWHVLKETIKRNVKSRFWQARRLARARIMYRAVRSAGWAYWG